MNEDTYLIVQVHMSRLNTVNHFCIKNVVGHLQVTTLDVVLESYMPYKIAPSVFYQISNLDLLLRGKQT